MAMNDDLLSTMLGVPTILRLNFDYVDLYHAAWRERTKLALRNTELKQPISS